MAAARRRPSVCLVAGTPAESQIPVDKEYRPAMNLLEFILNLLKDPQAQEQFNQHPQETLHANGFDGLCAADVHEAMPLVVDAVQNGSFERAYNGGGPTVTQTAHDPAGALPGSGGLEGAIRNIQYITDNYSYADSHNTMLDNSVNQNIWANGDVYQSFDNSPVVASGAGAVAAGHDVSGTITTGDHNLVGNGNAVGNGDAVGTGNAVNNGTGATSFGSGGAQNVGTAVADHGSGLSIGSGEASGDAADNSTNVHDFGSGNVAVAGAGGSTSQTDSHATTTTTTDSHNTTDSHAVVASGNTVASNDPTTTTTDSHNVTDSHSPSLTELYSHDTTTDTTTSDSYNHTGAHHALLDAHI